MTAKRGLYSNIAAKRKRIKEGSGEKMRPVGSAGSPTPAAFKAAAKTAAPPAPPKTPKSPKTTKSPKYPKKK